LKTSTLGEFSNYVGFGNYGLRGEAPLPNAPLPNALTLLVAPDFEYRDKGIYYPNY
jgi:hypothetical protein